MDTKPKPDEEGLSEEAEAARRDFAEQVAVAKGKRAALPAVSSTDWLGEDRPCKNTDTEIWRERRGDYYADSIHVTESGAIGINCGGSVIVAPVRRWHEAGRTMICGQWNLPRWRYRLALWLLGRSSPNVAISCEGGHTQQK